MADTRRFMVVPVDGGFRVFDSVTQTFTSVRMTDTQAVFAEADRLEAHHRLEPVDTEYGPDSTVGMAAGDDPARAFDRADGHENDTGRAAAIAVAASAAAAADDGEPIVLKDPFGEPFKFLHPSRLPSLDRLILTQMAQASSEGDQAHALQVAAALIPTALRTLMGAEEFIRFQVYARTKYIGDQGFIDMASWINGTIGPMYIGVPTQRAQS